MDKSHQPNLIKFSLNIQLSASASVPSTTESIQTSLEPDQIFYQKTFEHFRQVFLAFPCSNKVVVNQLFDVYEEMPSSKYTSSRSMVGNLMCNELKTKTYFLDSKERENFACSYILTFEYTLTSSKRVHIG